jgi:malate dehydrogenase (oxaloacetate-decarboxylating)
MANLPNSPISPQGKLALELHKKYQGKLAVQSKVEIKTKEDLSWAYTPGVAAVSLAIAHDKNLVYSLTNKANAVAILTDGSAVLGLGNIGAEAALPVMEGKAILFKTFANIDAYPICLATQDTKEIIMIARALAPVFGGINLEDISAPRCFEVEDALQDLGIPVMHDDQHGTAVVLLAALLNALQVVGKKLNESTIVINGAGAAGYAIFRMLTCTGYDSRECTPVKNIIVCDSKGIITRGRQDISGNPSKIFMAEHSNVHNVSGQLVDAIKNADVFIGVSVKNVLTQNMVRTMAKNSIIFALANPDPEILPQDAYAAGAAIVGTGRSDFPNQINNVLGFPGIFRGALDARSPRITNTMKLAASRALAGLVIPSKDSVLPSPLDPRVVPAVSAAVRNAARQSQQ